MRPLVLRDTCGEGLHASERCCGMHGRASHCRRNNCGNKNVVGVVAHTRLLTKPLEQAGCLCAPWCSERHCTNLALNGEPSLHVARILRRPLSIRRERGKRELRWN